MDAHIKDVTLVMYWSQLSLQIWLSAHNCDML